MYTFFVSIRARHRVLCFLFVIQDAWETNSPEFVTTLCVVHIRRRKRRPPVRWGVFSKVPTTLNALALHTCRKRKEFLKKCKG